MAEHRHPSNRNEKLGGRKTLADVRWELNTQGIEWVSLADRRKEKVRLSSQEALADIRWELNTHSIERISLSGRKMER